MYPACNSSSTRPSRSLPPGFTPMLIAAARTSTYGAGCPKICLRMCCNIRRALSLTLRRPYATTSGAVRPPERLEHRGGAAPPPAPPRPSEGTLAAAVGGRTVLDLARRAPVRPLRAANAPRPYHRAAWTLPFRGGPVQRRAPAPPRPSQRILVPLAAPLRGLRVRGCAA